MYKIKCAALKSQNFGKGQKEYDGDVKPLMDMVQKHSLYPKFGTGVHAFVYDLTQLGHTSTVSNERAQFMIEVLHANGYKLDNYCYKHYRLHTEDHPEYGTCCPQCAHVDETAATSSLASQIREVTRRMM